MDMKLRILATAMLATVNTGLLSAADPQLLNLVMPDAKVLAGVNVDQAKTSPFGQFVLAQVAAQDQHLPQFVAQTGFDPTRDLDELLIASNGAQAHGTGLTLARGTFNIAKINAAAQSAGAVSETYKGITILEDPKHPGGFAFLSPTLAVAGDVASVKGAIDRQTLPAPLPAALLVQVNQLSGVEDAWAISEVPPPPMHPPTNNPNTPNLSGVLQNIQQATGGVKFGSQVSITADLTANTAQNATALASVLQFLVNMAQLQSPQESNLLKSSTITANGTQVNVSINVPEAEAETLFQIKPNAHAAQPNARRRTQ
jgi:hypothetical protein